MLIGVIHEYVRAGCRSAELSRFTLRGGGDKYQSTRVVPAVGIPKATNDEAANKSASRHLRHINEVRSGNVAACDSHLHDADPSNPRNRACMLCCGCCRVSSKLQPYHVHVECISKSGAHFYAYCSTLQTPRQRTIVQCGATRMFSPSSALKRRSSPWLSRVARAHHSRLIPNWNERRR